TVRAFINGDAVALRQEPCTRQPGDTGADHRDIQRRPIVPRLCSQRLAGRYHCPPVPLVEASGQGSGRSVIVTAMCLPGTFLRTDQRDGSPGAAEFSPVLFHRRITPST